ncbi:HAMP domain-containing protein [bacterium]|nr:MAG: HAMP domain-containing protein [bacterium]
MRTYVKLPVPLRSMRARMTSLFALLVALLMFAAGAAVLRREERRTEKRVKESLMVAVEAVESEISEVESQGKPFTEILKEEQGEIAAGGLLLILTDAEGKTVWKSRHDAPTWPSMGDNWRFQTIARDGETLVIAKDWAPIQEEFRDTREGLWLLGIVVVAGTAMLAWFVVGQTLSPLGKLAAQAQNASIESLQVKLHSPSSDAEMLHLTATLNTLLSRLEKEAQARGRFYAAASHELRTPIQVLLGEVDVVRSRKRSTEEYEAALAQVQENTERLAQLVSDLLQLNALEMRQTQAPCEPVNLRFWVERAAQQQELAANERGLLIDAQLMDSPIQAPPLHLEILLRNLMENAVKYSEPDKTIRLTLEAETSRVKLEIWNVCAMGAETDPGSWFEPFYRPDASRSSETGGNGLGLAICRAVCTANGWKITLANRDQGLLATVTFPT